MNANIDPQRDMMMWWRQHWITNCLACSCDLEGNPKVNHGAASGHGIRHTEEAAHEVQRAHRKRIGQQRHLLPRVLAQARAPGSVFTPRVQVVDVRWRCRVCSLSKLGVVHDDYWDIVHSTALAHVTSPDHIHRADRLTDPRFNLFLQAGIPWVAPP